MSDRLTQAVAPFDHYRRQRDKATPDLFSALESVADHAGDEWRDKALDVVRYLALTRDAFTVEHPDPHPPPTIDKRVVGWVMRRGARLGWYYPVGYENGGPSRHRRPVALSASDPPGR
jgi:hypothetical protein